MKVKIITKQTTHALKKLLLLIVLMVSCSLGTYAQGKMTDVVYLKDGSIIRGTIVEQILGKSLKIETADGSVYNYPIDQVEKIAKERVMKKRSIFGEETENTPPFPYKGNDYAITGFRGMIDVGYIAGAIKGPELGVSLGYQINNYLFVGAGAGVQYATDLETINIPVFADVRGNLMTGSILPFVALRIGYGKLIDSSLDGGFYCHPFAGVKFMVTPKNATTLAIGWSTNKYETSYMDVHFKTSLNALTLKLGYEF